MLHLHFISKSQAKEIGLKRFFDGSMCKHGHISERNVSNGFCSECTAIYQAEYEAKRRVNTERKAYMKAYLSNYENNGRKDTLRRYYNKNRIKELERSREKRINNASYYRTKHVERLAKIRIAIPLWHEKENVLIVYEKARELGMEVDHIVPVTSDFVSGLHCWHNLQLLERTENRSKSNKFWPDMPDTIDPELIRMVEEFKNGREHI